MNPIIRITRPIVDKLGKTKGEIAAEMKRARTLSPGCFLVMDASGSDSRGSPLAVAWVVVTPEGVLAESGSRLLRPDDTTQLRLGPRLPATRYHIEQSPYLQSKTLAKLTALVKKVRSLSGGSSHQLMFASEEGRTLLQGSLGRHGRDIAAAAAGSTSMNIEGLHEGCVHVAESLLN